MKKLMLLLVLFTSMTALAQEKVIEPPSRENIVEEIATRFTRLGKSDANLQAQVNVLAEELARLKFIVEKFGEEKTLSAAYSTADEDWKQKLEVVNRQAELIKAQQSEIETLRAENAALREDGAKEK